jgi:peptidoglycan hydrolase-like protein with peptidoglycan-binding domain
VPDYPDEDGLRKPAWSRAGNPAIYAGVVIEPFTPRPRRRSRARRVFWVAAAGVVAAGGLALAALLAWPRPGLAADGDALARISLPGFAGHVVEVSVRDPGGAAVPVDLRGGRLWPTIPVTAGTRLTVEVAVRRPGTVAWLVGRTVRKTFVVQAPEARLTARWLRLRHGGPVTVRFDQPVRLVRLGVAGAMRTVRLAQPRRVVTVRAVSTGSGSAGTVLVSATARAWERLPAPVAVTWFPAARAPQALVVPAVGRPLRPDRPITLTFSAPVAAIFGSKQPTISPATPGSWRLLDSHTLTFVPSGLGFGLGTHVRVRLPAAVVLARRPGAGRIAKLDWNVPEGSMLRLQQLLAQAGYLPVAWKATSDPLLRTPAAQIAAALQPPPGHFRWRYSNTPPELRSLWHTGKWNDVTRAAVMTFEDTHGLDVDAFVGPKVWRALLADTLAGKPPHPGYSYVFVHRSLPQSLNLWHNGRVIVSSPGNTGVPAAPTQLGSFPVFEHIPVGTMSGTNPDGTHYHDPGIRYISYFNHGDAIHAFNRSSFGTPQSLGCVELPLAAAAKVWPYTPIGTLVTIEN